MPAAPSAARIAWRNCGCLKRREIRASALRCRPAELSGAKSTKKRYVGLASIAEKSTPERLRPNAASRPGRPGSLPCGMATPSPIPVEPSFSRSSSVSVSFCAESDGYALASAAQSSERTAALSAAARSGMTRSSRRNSAMRIARDLTSLRGQLLVDDGSPVGSDEPEVAVLAAVDDVHLGAAGPGEDEEVVVEQIHLHQRLLHAHRLGEELVAPDHLGL